MRPKICNSLAEDFKDLASFRKFTEFFKTRHRPEFKYNIRKDPHRPYRYA